MPNTCSAYFYHSFIHISTHLIFPSLILVIFLSFPCQIHHKVTVLFKVSSHIPQCKRHLLIIHDSFYNIYNIILNNVYVLSESKQYSAVFSIVFYTRYYIVITMIMIVQERRNNHMTLRAYNKLVHTLLSIKCIELFFFHYFIIYVYVHDTGCTKHCY